MSRILATVYMRRLFRKTVVEGEATGELSGKEGIIGDTQLTGLNEFG